MSTQWIVMAKAPVPGRVKTRLCPPCTPTQAAAVAAAALTDTLATVGAVTAGAYRLALSGAYRPPTGWSVVTQRGDELGERLAHAFHDTARPATASLLVGADTPQLTTRLLRGVAAALLTAGVDAVLGPAVDGGWWVLGLRDPAHAAALPAVATSTSRTGADTLAALRRRALRVRLLPTLRDVDTAADAHAVAAACPPDSHFRRAVAAHVPALGGVR